MSRQNETGRSLHRLIPIGAFVATLLVVLIHGGLRDGWGIDEAHKVADTAFFGHLVHGELHHPDWTRHIVDRTNPPVGKFVFGLAATLAGAPLPPTVRIRQELPDGTLGQALLPDDARRYHRTLLACRAASLVATALTAALVALLALRLGNGGAAVAATALFVAHYLVQTLATRAVYDPLLVLWVTAAVACLGWPPPPSTRGQAARDLGVAVLCALAFETRASGAIALAAVACTLLVEAVSSRSARALVRLAIIGGVAAAVAFAINPYYWNEPRGVFTQFRELAALAAGEATRQAPLASLGSRGRFAVEIVLGDVAGLLMLLGTMLAIALGVVRRRRALVPFATAAAVVVLGIIAWLPFPWPRYLLVPLPLLAVAAALGFIELGRREGS